MMLPRSQRISTSAFTTAFRAGLLLRCGSVQLRVFRRDGAGSLPRAAFVVPKKVGKATLRNRLRRRFREQFRLHPGRLDARLQGCDLIFMLSAAAIEAPAQEFYEALDQLLPRAARSIDKDKRAAQTGAAARTM